MSVSKVHIHYGYTFIYFNLQQVEALMAYIQASKYLAKAELKAFAQALVANELGPLSVHPGASVAHCVLVDLAIHLATVLLCGHQQILAPLQQLALTPANMQVCILIWIVATRTLL